MKKIAASLALLALPVVAYAQAVVDADSLFVKVRDLINKLIPIIITLAIFFIVWGVFRYMIAKTDDAKTKGRDAILWGAIGLFAMLSIWGLVNLLARTFNLQNTIPESQIQNLVPRR